MMRPSHKVQRRQQAVCAALCCLVVVLFLATSQTVGRVWRGGSGCIENTLSANGLWVSSSSQGTVSQVILALGSLGLEVTSLLDIGANTGAWTTNVWRAHPNVEILMLEGNLALEPALKQASALTGHPYRMAIVGDEEKDVVFNVMCSEAAPCAGGSSVFAETTGWGEKTEKRHMTTVDALVAGLIPAGGFTMVKIDVQGAEVIALKGATETLKSVQAILLETSNVEYNKGAPQTLEVRAYC